MTQTSNTDSLQAVYCSVKLAADCPLLLIHDSVHGPGWAVERRLRDVESLLTRTLCCQKACDSGSAYCIFAR